jgi:xanthine dehydrogenase accessory factor
MMDASGHIQDEKRIYQRLAEMSTGGQPGVLATVISAERSTPRHSGSKMIIHPDGSITGSIGGGKAEAVVMAEAARVLADGICRRLELDLAGQLGVCGGKMEVFLEPVLRATPFVVIGAGHVGRALEEMGRSLAFRFTLVDDRPEFLEPLETVPGLNTVAADPDHLGGQIAVDARAAVVIASRNHELDGRYLKVLLEAEAAAGLQFGFLGVLGSRSKAAKLRKSIAQQVPDLAPRLETIQMPVGLDVGSESPPEIALSILAEALAVLRGVDFLADESGSPLGLRLHRRRRPGAGS